MAFDSATIDATDWKILKITQQDGRISFAEIGRRVRLTAPAVAERVRRLEDRGVLLGVHASVSLEHAGRPLLVFVRLKTTPGQYKRFHDFARQSPEVIAAHHVTGSEAYILEAALSSVAHLETFIAEMSAFGETSTSIVLSSPVRKHAIEPAF